MFSYFPVKNLDSVAAAVTKYKQLLREWVEAQGIFHQYRQPVYAFAEVDGIPAQVDRWQIV